MMMPPQKKSNGALIALLVIGGLVVLCGGLAAVGALVGAKTASEAVAEDANGYAVTSTDGKSKIEVPSGWSTISDLNDDAEIQVGNESRGEFLIVISEPKTDFETGFSLNDYGDLITTNMKEELEGAKKTGPKELTVRSRDALRYEMEGVIERLNIKYSITILEGDDHFHQVIGWTINSRFESTRPKFEKVAGSFRELN